MNESQALLWEQISNFQLDVPGAVYSFSKRLAKENRWEYGYALRVIQEYKRFVFLACCAGHGVSPSDAVDQAWHLHLLYTTSYWDQLCKDILCRPLHHIPSHGGKVEQQKYGGWYANTLASYQRFFGIKAPEDIWPSQEQAHHFVRVDLLSYELLPKRTLQPKKRFWFW